MGSLIELWLWISAVLLVLGILVARALRNTQPMPEEMAAADEDFKLIFQERTVYQRPASERFKDLGGEL